MKVTRFDGSEEFYGDSVEEMTEEEALFASWDYWETRGLEHPLKRNALVPELKPIAKKDLTYDT